MKTNGILASIHLSFEAHYPLNTDFQNLPFFAENLDLNAGLLIFRQLE